MKLKAKAQSALEYLMTYGWSLVVIAIVIGTLIFIAAPTSSDLVFFSATSQFLVKDSNFDHLGGDNSANLILQNATGGPVQITKITGTGSACISCGMLVNNQVPLETEPVIIPIGAKMLITGIDLPRRGPISGTFEVDYINQSGLQKTGIISVQGKMVEAAVIGLCSGKVTNLQADPCYGFRTGPDPDDPLYTKTHPNYEVALAQALSQGCCYFERPCMGADITGDGFADIIDLVNLATYSGQTGCEYKERATGDGVGSDWCHNADVDHSGTVQTEAPDTTDIDILRAFFGGTDCTQPQNVYVEFYSSTRAGINNQGECTAMGCTWTVA